MYTLPDGPVWLHNVQGPGNKLKSKKKHIKVTQTSNGKRSVILMLPVSHQLSSSDFLWENQGGLEMQRKVPQIQWNPSHLPVNIFHPSLCAEKSSVISRKVWECFRRAKSLISISESPCKIPHQTDFHASTHHGMTRDPDLWHNKGGTWGPRMTSHVVDQ